MHDHQGLYVTEGVILIVLGAAAIMLPLVASFTIESFLGWLFFIGGIAGLVTTTLGRYAPGFWWSLLSAAVAIVAGALMIGWPISGVVSLTFILTFYLVADGIFMIMFALEHRRQLSQRWIWPLINGLLDLGLAGLIVWTLPTSAGWVLGVIVGIDMLFGGMSLITMATAPDDENIRRSVI